MPVAQTNMPLRDGQAGLYPLFLMKSVHRIHPFIFCMVPVFRPVWCHGKTAVHCRNLALFRCFGALNWYHTPILVSLGYHAQPALRADVSSRRRESGVFLSPAIFFDRPHGDPPGYSPGFRRSPASPHPGYSGPVRPFQGRGGHLPVPGLWRETPGKAAACDGCDDGDDTNCPWLALRFIVTTVTIVTQQFSADILFGYCQQLCCVAIIGR